MSRILMSIVGLILIAGMLPALAFESPPSRRDLTITTGTRGGTYVRIGEQMVRVLERHRGETIGRVQSTPSAGTLENLDRLSSGQADLGLVVGPVFASDSRRDDIHALMALYTDVMQVVVRNGASINGVRDLAGKRVYLGSPKSGTKWIATRVLKAAGMTEGYLVRLWEARFAFDE